MDSKDLLLSIAHCKRNAYQECSQMFAYQRAHGFFDLLPVPWQGHLEKAKILFIGSNPSPLDNGCLATNIWSDDNKIIDFHECRFDKREDNNPNKPRWSSNGTYYLLNTGQQSTRPVPYWGVLKNSWTPEIGKYYPLGEIISGETYALTEIVHCYSKKDNILTQRCKELCSKSFLNDILKFAINAKIIAIMGKHSTQIINEYLKRHSIIRKGQELDWRPLIPIRQHQQKTGLGLIKTNLFGRDLLLIALPHPGAYQYKTLLDCYLTPEELKVFKNLKND